MGPLLRGGARYSVAHPLKETIMPLLDLALEPTPTPVAPGPISIVTDLWPIGVVLLIVVIALVVVVAWRQSRRG